MVGRSFKLGRKTRNGNESGNWSFTHQNLAVAFDRGGIVGGQWECDQPVSQKHLFNSYSRILPQAIAQDIASLILVSPLWLILAILELRGSLRAGLVWLGVLTFTAYNYMIYTFSVPFGALFPYGWLFLA